MTCAEFEVWMAEGEIHGALQAHLEECAGCKAVWRELEANRHALRAMGLEAVPAAPIRIRPGLPWWKWTSAAAALILTSGGTWWASRPAKPPQIVSIDVKVTGILPKKEIPLVHSEIPAVLQPAVLPVVHAEPLRVKMLTPDPDVVIYWLVDRKGE
ncbi:MAG TPA: hypothetical protein VGJ09_09430 [Bryobacteraceae bacterium]